LKMPITLALSLHSSSDTVRSEIMPVSRKYNIKEVIAACKYYTDITKRRLTFEYALIKEVNDSEEHAYQLSNLLKGGLFHVNLIPVNKVSETGYEKPNIKTIEGFKKILIKNGIETTQRREMGSDINAACGQLRKSFIEESEI
jgi:23S rRNA (adenine2503-C2)-methyltransferase